MKALIALSLLCLAAARAGDGRMHINFDGPTPEGWSAEGAEAVPGRTGQGLFVGPGAQVSLPAPGFIMDGFDATLWISHRQALADLHLEELVYLYHDTPDMRNRICLKKRIGTDRILFAMSDSTDRAKGAIFAGDWFAMQTAPLDWPANTWHCIRVTASRTAGRAALYVDGEQVAAAEGSQLPDEPGTLWLGSWSGRSQALAVFDDIVIAPAQE